jgi:hypothetical protein
MEYERQRREVSPYLHHLPVQMVRRSAQSKNAHGSTRRQCAWYQFARAELRANCHHGWPLSVVAREGRQCFLLRAIYKEQSRWLDIQDQAAH